jgi:diguanylate cyclase (GGDEF)-like protein
MTAITGPLARLERSRDELAKAWLVRLIERASLEEIRDLPTERIARELPELISDVVQAVASNGKVEHELTPEQLGRASALAALREGRDASASELARDIASLQSVLVRAIHEELGDQDPEGFARAVERLAEAVGVVQAAAVEEHIRSRSRELEAEANTDPLTGLFNLRYLQRQTANVLDVHKRYQHPFALLIMDIDGLKRINDAYGHAAGDRLLMQVAVSIRRSVRSVDSPARLGGDEFCVLAPNQDASHGAALAERLAKAVQEGVATPDGTAVGISIGIVSCPEHGEEADVLMELADKAMYRAKASGETVAMGEREGAAVPERAKSP